MPISRGLSGQLEDGEIPDHVGFSDGLQKFRGKVLSVTDQAVKLLQENKICSLSFQFRLTSAFFVYFALSEHVFCMQGGIVLKVIDLRLRNTPRASSLTHNPANSHDFTLNND